MPADQGSTYGPQAPFTPENSASETSQAQFKVANDAIPDVDNNSVIARTQAQTAMLAGSEFEAAAARRTIIADKLLDKTS